MQWLVNRKARIFNVLVIIYNICFYMLFSLNNLLLLLLLLLFVGFLHVFFNCLADCFHSFNYYWRSVYLNKTDRKKYIVQFTIQLHLCWWCDLEKKEHLMDFHLLRSIFSLNRSQSNSNTLHGIEFKKKTT